MESARLSDPKIKDSLLNIRNKINSISRLYDLLGSSKNEEEIPFEQYIEKIIASLIKSYFKENEKINLEMHLDKIQVNVDIALSVGLILNELVTNSLKYAFPDNRKGSIKITLERKNMDIVIEVCDDGIGTVADVSSNNNEGLGMSIVKLLTEQIGGNIKKVNIKNGTLFRIQFPIVKSIR